MPLIHGKSKKAFSKNVEAEMRAGKPQPQALAIAYSVKRKPKKMAKGGAVNESARSESRPMPEERDKDAMMVAHNTARKALKDSGVLDQPTVRQAQDNNGRKVLPIKTPRMVPSNAFSVRMRDEEADLQNSAKVNDGSQIQPPKHDDEEGPDRQGPQVRDMQDEHSTHRKPYAKGGEIEASDEHHKLDGKYEDDLLDLPPSEDEGMMMAEHDDEEGQDRQGPKVPDMEREHSNGRNPYAKGGDVHREEDDTVGTREGLFTFPKEDHGDSEMEEEHHDSIAAAIMAKRDRMHAMIDSGAMDMDHAVRMADGGEINGMDSIYAHPEEDQVDLSRNAEEDANMEDRSSFDALRKENYSESAGLAKLDQPRDSNLKGDSREDEESDKHDMISSIRNKMASKRQFKVR